MKRIAIATLIALVSGGVLHAAGYKDDNVRWLVYDMKTKDKTLMDIRMDTYMKGTATFTGPRNRIGRRYAPMPQSSNYIVTMRRGVINVLDNAGAPIMWGEVDLDRGDIKGEFTEQYGGGSWVASEKGPSGTRMDLFQYCSIDPNAINSTSYNQPEDWSCQNVGQGEQCFYGWTGESVGSFILDTCVEVAKRHCLKVAAEANFVSKLLLKTYWDETAQKCETE